MEVGYRNHRALDWTQKWVEDFWRGELNGLIEVGASYIYIYTLPVLIRVKRREGKLIRETIRRMPQ